MASPSAVQYNSNGYGASPTSQVNSRDVQPQYPQMDVMPADKPLLEAIGAPGTAIFSGIITSEEYNPDWYWRDGIKIIEQMVRNDAQINATRTMLELPIRRAKWSIVPGSDSPQDQEVASFVQSCLMDDMCYQTASGRVLHQKWDDILRHILMHLTYGFIPFEVNYRIEDGWVKWARWTPLLPRTVWRWWVGPDNELAGIQQWTFKNYNYGFVNIPADKLLLFSNRQEGNNYEGVSVFRSAYKHWFYKEQYEKIDAIGIERNAVVPPVIHLPANATAADGAMGLQIAQNMRVNQMMGVTLPFGWDLEYPKNEQKYAAAVLPQIQYHDTLIARNVLCQFLDLGSTETGAYSLDKSQVNTFLSSLQAVCEYIEDVINNDAIRRLVDYNFDNVEVYPKLKCSKLTSQNTADLADALAKLMSGTTPLIQPDPQISNWLLEELGVPHSPQTQVEATNPTSEAVPNRPDNERAGDHSDAVGKNVKPNATDSIAEKQDTGGEAPGGNPAATSESMEQVRLLNETLERISQMDAVERGIAHQARQRIPKGQPGAGRYVKASA